MQREDYLSRIRNHYQRQWSAEPVAAPSGSGAGRDLPEGFSVLCFHRPQGRPLSVFATCGMSTIDDPRRIELHLCTPESRPEITDLLEGLAAHHRTEAPIDLNHILDLGPTQWPGSRCTRGFVSLPYVWGPSLEWLPLREGGVRCLWLIPITPEEEDLCQREGAQALESRIQATPLDYLTPTRPSAV